MDSTTVQFALQLLLGAAVLSPLLSFWVILLLGPHLGKHGSGAGYLATFAILTSFVLSAGALGIWLTQDLPPVAEHAGDSHGTESHGGDAHSSETHGNDAHGAAEHSEGGKTHSEGAQGAPAAGDSHAAAELGRQAATPTAFVQATDAPATANAADAHSTDAHAAEAGHAETGHADAGHAEAGHGEHGHAAPKRAYHGEWYSLGEFGKLRLSIGYYIDALTVAMFCMVTFIASCIHFYAQGYMHDELHDITDHEVTLSNGKHLHRPGRFHRFFQALSLFCFSMLGLVIAGNVAMTFVFWELVGICSYFLIGFYVERKSASTAANKAFIVNRVGDFGMILGLMALWSSLGTFNYADMFAQIRPEGGTTYVVPTSMMASAAPEEVAAVVRQHAGESPEAVQAAIDQRMVQLREMDGGNKLGYWLLIIAGVGIFCGCVGKSAQFPLHVWLPDAMEGPTPVSALVHSATMVAAGVFLVARFYPVFVPEVLFVISIVGTITLFMAATIAITANDIKRVLAYSTVSQLGYMMLSLGIGGWLAGVLHLFTHAFFKSLLFMCSGSVIHAVHTNDMRKMGGLRKKMPWTAYTMLVGCMAIAGAGIPFVIGFSGYYSKDAIIEQALLFRTFNGGWGLVFFLAAASGASITAFYMFRLWFMTFAGKPRDHHAYDHAHESPPIMVYPLAVLSVLAVSAAWGPIELLMGAAIAGVVFFVYRLSNPVETEETQAVRTLLLIMMVVFAVVGVVTIPAGGGNLAGLLEQARPERISGDQQGAFLTQMVWKDEHLSHAPEYKIPATLIASGTALMGFLFAVAFYGLRKLDPEDVRRQFAPVYGFLVNKWWFDELYHWVFVLPTHFIGKRIAQFDQRWIDGLIHSVAYVTRWMANVWDQVADRTVVDGSVNLLARWTMRTGLSLRRLQTGRLRQYVMFIVLGTVIVFLVLSVFWNSSLAR